MKTESAVKRCFVEGKGTSNRAFNVKYNNTTNP